MVADVTRPATLRPLPAAQTVLFSVGYDPGGGATRRQVYVEGLRAVLAAIGPDTRRVIFISSTGVYGDSRGQWVDEDTPCRPTREAGRALLDAERLLAGHPLGRRAIVLRLAGVYGPGRLPQLGPRGSQTPAATGLVNLIHVEDAAAVVLAAEARSATPRTYLVSDGHPTQRQRYLERLAELLGQPPPGLASTGAAGSVPRSMGDKRVSNRRMLDELGVELAYPDYCSGLAAAVAMSDEH